MARPYLRLSIDAAHPQRSIQLPVRLFNIAGYDHLEFTKACVRAGCWLNGILGKSAPLAIRIENHTVKAGFAINAG
ncbi:hypothetical protein [Sphingomonas endolithica]|uniref:hypothetical protein n=1 Tax=Sphingomonas endolithica TaxID=2972485 RepID=UPI0021AE4247|nr:hypothetical protein [Sphingomonas sp. ZFBP2030]